MADLKDKRIIITGAASGIGRATSILAAEKGAMVVAVDLDHEVEETVHSIEAAGGRAISVQADVSKEEAVEAFIERCVDEFGGVDGIYANAGIGGGGKPFLELSVDDWQRTLGVNTIGVFL